MKFGRDGWYERMKASSRPYDIKNARASRNIPVAYIATLDFRRVAPCPFGTSAIAKSQHVFSCANYIHRLYFGYMKIMMAIKTDVAVKKRAQKVAADLGLTLSAVVNAMLKQFVRDRAIALSAAPKMTPYLESLIAEVEEDLALGNNISKPLRSAKDIDAFFALI